MAKGSWKPLVVTGVLVAVVIHIIRDDGPRDAEAAGSASTPASTQASDQEPGPLPPPDGRVKGSSGTASSGSAPVREVDDIGTRRLSGRDGDTIALTFDDGPNLDYTPDVLDILRDHDVTATFCVLGDNAAAHPDLIRRIVAEGHTLCNHTITHDLTLRHKRELVIHAEIGGTVAAIRTAVPDAQIPFFRAPGGYFVDTLNDIAADYDQTPLGWSLDPADWRKPGADAIHAEVVDGAHPGAIVLLHDGGGDRSGTVKALPRIIDSLLRAGYTFVVPVS